MNNSFFTENQIEYIESQFGKISSVKPLQEEASTRRYFRIQSTKGEYVICLDDSVNLDFISLSKFLEDSQVHVPHVYSSNIGLGITTMSFDGDKDFGSLSLAEYKTKLPVLVDLLLKLQNLDPPELVLNRRFDTEKLSFEINLTKEKYDLFRFKYKIETELTQEMNAFLDETVSYLGQYPVQVFTHRDFHCRNILLHPTHEYCLIDFQDARLGIPQYDLASILYDAYYPLPRETRKEVLNYFKSKNRDVSKSFTEAFYLQALQRSFKALGTYFRMVVDHQKMKFKPSILSCLNQLEEIIQLGMFADSLFIFVRSLRNELEFHSEFK
ncbi:MAG: phosphotransferase [Leptospira sp.]|nr:phosphotransferase [Leptospira sp.]